MVAVVVACVAGVVAAVTGAANPVSAVQFLMPGHWVYNSALQSVFHVDGSTGNVDAQARVPGTAGDQVVAGDTSGYVIGSDRITEFGKSSLEVEESRTPVSREVPVGVETAGGPYLVYRETGKVVRLGDPSAVVSLGGPLGHPVAMRDGTVWLPRHDVGLLCRLTATARKAACTIDLPKGHSGALALVDDRPVYVDTTDDTLHTVEDDGLGDGRDLGVDVADDARLADSDVDGRVAILDAGGMHLVDAGDRPEETVTVDLPDGDYTGPVSTGQVVAVVDRATDTLSTYDGKGEPKERKVLPSEKGDPRISSGEDDRLYVDGEDGTHVVVVDRDGGLTDVPISGDGPDGEQTPPRGGADPDEQRVEVPPEPNLPPVPNPGDQRDREDRQEQPAPPPRQTPPTTPPSTETPPPPPPEVPATPPGAPAGVSATAGDGAATVNWGAAPDNRSAITAYTITWQGGSMTAGPAQRTATVPGLANGTSYTFTVTATNGIGAGPGVASGPVTPVAPVGGPPAAPTGLAAAYDQGTNTGTLSFDVPGLGGNELVHHVVEVTGAAPVYTTENQNVAITGIPDAEQLTYSVRTDTRTPDGTILHGATASVTIAGEPPAGPARVVLSRGPSTDDWCGPDPACAWMHVELTGFPPDTPIKLMPHSSDPNYGNEGHTTTTDGNGFADTDQFAYAGVGHTVWVTAELPDGTVITSSEMVWEAG